MLKLSKFSESVGTFRELFFSGSDFPQKWYLFSAEMFLERESGKNFSFSTPKNIDEAKKMKATERFFFSPFFFLLRQSPD